MPEQDQRQSGLEQLIPDIQVRGAILEYIEEVSTISRAENVYMTRLFGRNFILIQCSEGVSDHLQIYMEDRWFDVARLLSVPTCDLPLQIVLSRPSAVNFRNACKVVLPLWQRPQEAA